MRTVASMDPYATDKAKRKKEELLWETLDSLTHWAIGLR